MLEKKCVHMKLKQTKVSSHHGDAAPSGVGWTTWHRRKEGNTWDRKALDKRQWKALMQG